MIIQGWFDNAAVGAMNASGEQFAPIGGLVGMIADGRGISDARATGDVTPAAILASVEPGTAARLNTLAGPAT